MVIIGIGLAMGGGAASYISRILRAKDKQQVNRTAAISLFGSMILGAIVIIPALIFLEPLLKL